MNYLQSILLFSCLCNHPLTPFLCCKLHYLCSCSKYMLTGVYRIRCPSLAHSLSSDFSSHKDSTSTETLVHVKSEIKNVPVINVRVQMLTNASYRLLCDCIKNLLHCNEENWQTSPRTQQADNIPIIYMFLDNISREENQAFSIALFLNCSDYFRLLC